MMCTMTEDEMLAVTADANFEQYFLVSPEKITMLKDTAGIRPTDSVMELGAGAGTVARSLPECESLTVVELDDRLVALLRKNAPRAHVVRGDALRVIREIPCDVLISNLPNGVTESLLDILPEISFRTAVITVGGSADLDRLRPAFNWSEVTTISGDDFVPPQAAISRVVRVTPA